MSEIPGRGAVNHACNCCMPPPEPSIFLESVSVYETCTNDVSCGWIDRNAVYPEKCQFYGTRVVANGGFSTGQIVKTHYSREQNPNKPDDPCAKICVEKTSCSGSKTVTFISSGCESNPSGSLSLTEVVTTTWATNENENGCISTLTRECSGSSSSFSANTPWYSGLVLIGEYDQECSSTTTSSDNRCVTQSNYTLYRRPFSGNPYTESFSSSGSCCSGAVSGTRTASPEELWDDFGRPLNTESGENPKPPCSFCSSVDYPSDFFTDKKYISDLPKLEAGQSRSSPTLNPAPTAQAFYYSSAFGQAKSRRKTKWRIVHTPSGTCYLKIWFRKRTQKYKLKPDSCNDWVADGDPIYTELPFVYEWEGEKTPCWKTRDIEKIDDSRPTTYRSINAVPHRAWENLIYGAPQLLELGDQGQDGFGVLEDIAIHKYSFLRDYEPEDASESHPWEVDTSGRCQSEPFPRPCCPNCDT